MKKRALVQVILATATVLLLSGCGEKFPDLTEDQYNQTVEYAAGLLMKYSNNDQERLVVVDAKEVLKQREKEAQKEAERAAKLEEIKNKNNATQETTQPVQVEEVTEPAPEELTTDPELAGEEEVEGLAEKEEEKAGEEETSAASSDPNAITLSSDQSQEITDNIFLSYQGYSVSSTYPESSKSYVVNADKGKKLLVLRFDLYNAANSSMHVNMIPLGLSFKIILNGKDIGYSSVTFLPNDLSSYVGTIDSKAHESVVVLTQISEKDSKNIDTLGMIVTLNGQNQTVNLQ